MFFSEEKGIYSAREGLIIMRLRVNMRDIVDLILTQNYREFQEKYSLSSRNLHSLKRALKKGKWRIARGWVE
jgi:hypothetical protein